MTFIGYAWEIAAAAFILIALMYWCFIEGSEDEDDYYGWSVIDEDNRVLKEARKQ